PRGRRRVGRRVASQEREGEGRVEIVRVEVEEARVEGLRKRNMGQKVHPYGFRIGYNRTWHSRWYSETDYLKHLHDDLKLREELKRDLANAAVSEIEIERGNKLKINIMTARPGVIIGKKGASVDQLRDRLQKRLGKDIHVNIIEIQRPETDAQLVAESIAMQL